jgi:hypothetical protein
MNREIERKMPITKKILLILPLILIVSCEYGSFNECVKEEIRKNDGNFNAYINEYCRENFPIEEATPTDSSERFNRYPLVMDDKVTKSSEEVGSFITITIQNNSTDKTVKAMRAYFFTTSDCKNASVTLDRDDYQYRFTNIGPLQTGTLTFNATGNSNCMISNIKGE